MHGLIVLSIDVEVHFDVGVPNNLWIYKKGKELQALIFFKSSKYAQHQQSTEFECNCDSSSTCKILPYSTQEQCQCPPGYDGDRCDEISKTSLSSALDSLMSETAKVPTMSDVYFNVEDAREEIKFGFSGVEKTIIQMGESIKECLSEIKYDMLMLSKIESFTKLYNPKLLEMQNAIKLSQPKVFAIFDTTKYIGYKALEKRIRKKAKREADKLLQTEKIPSWKLTLEYMIGTEKLMLDMSKLEPMMLLLINSHGDIKNSPACLPKYKSKTDSILRDFMKLQYSLNVLHVTSSFIMEEDVTVIKEKYNKTIKDQV